MIVACPYCESSDNLTPVYLGYPDANVVWDYSVYHCENCDNPFVTKTTFVPQTTVLKLEGIGPTAKPPEIPTEGIWL